MRFNPISLVGLGFFLLAFFSALRVRRDLATMQTGWGRALFARPTAPILRTESPVRYWLAIAVNTLVVLLFTLSFAFALRVTAWRLTRL
jgi:hypothetical protein